MAFPPNYRQDRTNRERKQEAKKQEKLRRLTEASALRKAQREALANGDPEEAQIAPAKDTTQD